MLLGALGKRESEDGRGTSALNASERAVVKRQVLGVMAKSIIIAVIVTGVVMAV